MARDSLQSSHMDIIAELRHVIDRRDVRSADRANMRVMLNKLQHGESLSYQERQNLWAYIERYSRQPESPTHRPPR
jgi:hypothetical protein